MSAVGSVHHVTLLCTSFQLQAVRAFYEQVIGLKTGARPDFDFPGAWLYAGEEPIVHLAAVLSAPADDLAAPAATVLPGARASTGAIDHIALRVEGAVEDFRTRLRAQDIRFTEAPVPGYPLHQLFLNDPLGVKIELNFEVTP